MMRTRIGAMDLGGVADISIGAVDPGGVADISRGLSAAIPPVHSHHLNATPEGVAEPAKTSGFCDPSRIERRKGPRTGGIAALNPRLISTTPPGSRTPGSRAVPIRELLARKAHIAFLKHFGRRSKRRPGLTLLEVVIALAIFLFSLVAIYQLVSIGTDRALDVQQQAQASMLCQSKMNEVLAGAEASGSGTVEINKLVWNYTIESNPGEVEYLNNVKVTVRFDRPDGKVIEATLNQMVLDPAQRGSTLTSGTATSSSTTPPATTPSTTTPTGGSP